MSKFLQQRRGAHLGKHVEAVVAGGAVRAQRNRYLARQHLGDARQTRSEFQIRRRTMRDVRLRARQRLHFLSVEMDAMREQHVRARDSQRIKISHVTPPSLRFDNLAFVFVFRRMRVNHYLMFPR